MVEIPKEERKPVNLNPNMMIIYSLPKAGKTTICSKLKNHLILELESGGADFVNGRVMDIDKATIFTETLEAIKASKEKVCDYLIVDTITRLDEYSEIVGTYLYMGKTTGKTFNLDTEQAPAKRLTHNDKRFQTVHEIPQGYGYQYSRTVMTEWYSQLLELVTLGKVKHIILLAHIKDKFIESKSGDLVESIDLNLTGKVKSIFSSRVDAIGYLVRKGKAAYLSFSSPDKVVCGGRCHHLDGEILIAEKDGDDIKTYWDRIYLP